MVAEVIYTVFVSSTYEDLREERAEVQKALLMLRCLPIGMELFGSADEETWEFIKRQIEAADYYLVIIADKYGSLAGDGKSYTEKEFDHAREIGKPVLAFVHGARGSIERDLTESDPDKRAKLEGFIKKIQSSPVSFFTTPHELATIAIASFVNLRERSPAIGYIRSNQAVNLIKYTELLEENVRLKDEISEIKGTISLFPEANENFEFGYDLLRTSKGNTELVESDKKATLTWAEIFLIVSENVILSNGIQTTIIAAVAKRGAGKLGEATSVRFGQNPPFSSIKTRLFGWGLVDFHETTGGGPIPGRFTAWQLTDYGRAQYGLLMPK